MLQSVAVCCSVLQRSAVWCKWLQCVFGSMSHEDDFHESLVYSVMQCDAVWCSEFHCSAAWASWCKWLQFVSLWLHVKMTSTNHGRVMCCSVLHLVAVCCCMMQYVYTSPADNFHKSRVYSALQCVAVYCTVLYCVLCELARPITTSSTNHMYAVCCSLSQCVAAVCSRENSIREPRVCDK